ncbi:hypothetical protein PoB_001639200 [Plakobranchus ocellatus]|uniref:Uncharacterized protein n=1 Tax=Plakobranchus ocellatus TaxID=259542 RepID=A0AAV3Z5R7_9GAST|nr:hypothetical protein PoB_001639200 [Plakobranchus ocellatus]
MTTCQEEPQDLESESVKRSRTLHCDSYWSTPIAILEVASGCGLRAQGCNRVFKRSYKDASGVSQPSLPIHNKVISGFRAPRQGASGGARTRDRRVSADFGADPLATVRPTPPRICQMN